MQLIHPTCLALTEMQAVFVQMICACWMLISVTSRVKDGAVGCFFFFLIQRVISEKQGDCAEGLHCVTAGSRGKGREGRQEVESRGTAREERGVSSLT